MAEGREPKSSAFVGGASSGRPPPQAPEALNCWQEDRGEGAGGPARSQEETKRDEHSGWDATHPAPAPLPPGAVVDACAATRSAESIKPSEGPLEMLQARTRLLTLRAGRIGLPKKVPADQEGRQHEQQAAQKRIQRRHTADVWDGMDRKREKA
ncbi:unnamed protein product [Prorocentrum cordatum]|uniref:Ribosome biogenesis protein NOP53 n=1 Tax=Prorocentrum cordatum TaxID=2364126 RepID=A0ABN9S0Y2_9DINO|nr:unnamed protein product [Polarella glacialis]